VIQAKEIDGELWVKASDHHKAIKESLAQTQEPVAWRSPNWGHSADEYVYRDFDDPVIGVNGKPSPNNEPLYAHQPQRTWVGLDHQDKKKFSSWLDHKTDDEVFTAIDDLLREMNT